MKELTRQITKFVKDEGASVPIPKDLHSRILHRVTLASRPEHVLGWHGQAAIALGMIALVVALAVGLVNLKANDLLRGDAKPSATTTDQAPTDAIPGPAGRFGAGMAYDSVRGESLVFGGQDAGGSYLAETWSWNGRDWRQLHPTITPPARIGGQLVSDPVSRSVILIGGTGRVSANMIGQLSDMWSWNGTTWTQLRPRHFPPNRVDASLTYDSKAKGILLFGGNSGDRVPLMMNDLWLWTGSDWAEQHPFNRPPARSAATLVFDPASGRSVLFGGTNGLVLNDTWAWDGASWSELKPYQFPVGRYSAGAVYDSASRAIVLFGGEGGESQGPYRALDDTWIWNGKTWVEQHPPKRPKPRWMTSMSYDVANGVVVLFGGPPADKFSLPLGDTWIWNGINWRQALASNSSG